MEISFTYDTQEAAETGDSSDYGFYDPDHGCHDSMVDEETKAYIEANPDEYVFKGGLVAAIETAKKLGCSESNFSPIFSTLSKTSVSFSTADAQINYKTGDSTNYTVHFKDISPRTLLRLAKAFKARVYVPRVDAESEIAHTG